MVLLPAIALGALPAHGAGHLRPRAIPRTATLVFGRVDRLSLVFSLRLLAADAHRHALRAPRGRRCAARCGADSTSAAPSGRMFAGDFLTLFVFWEYDGLLLGVARLAAAGHRSRSPRDSATCWSTSSAGCVCSAGMMLHLDASRVDRLRQHVGLRRQPRLRADPDRASFSMPPCRRCTPGCPTLTAKPPSTARSSCARSPPRRPSMPVPRIRGHGDPRLAGRDHGPLRRRLRRARKRLPPPARLPHHQPGRLHGGGVGLGHRDGHQRRLRPRLRAHPLQGPALHGLRRRAAHDRPRASSPSWAGSGRRCP